MFLKTATTGHCCQSWSLHVGSEGEVGGDNSALDRGDAGFRLQAVAIAGRQKLVDDWLRRATRNVGFLLRANDFCGTNHNDERPRGRLGSILTIGIGEGMASKSTSAVEAIFGLFHGSLYCLGPVGARPFCRAA